MTGGKRIGGGPSPGQRSLKRNNRLVRGIVILIVIEDYLLIRRTIRASSWRRRASPDRPA